MSKKLQEEFDRFIAFGNLLDRTTRRYLVQYLHHLVEPAQEMPPILEDAYYRYFSRALDDIFAHEDLLFLIREKGAVSEQILIDTLSWIRKAYRNAKAVDPFEAESSRLQQWSITPLARWAEAWHIPLNFLRNQYKKEELDPGFYERKFKQLLGKRNLQELSEPDRNALELLLKDLLAQWDALLSARLLEFQLKKLEEEKESFAAHIQNKAEQFARLTRLIQPFAEYTGKYWDLSKDLWQDQSFNLLEKYEELLQEEKAVQKLVDMLGKMREAEIELEEETYERVIVRKQWVEDYEAKAEIDGIHESNQLSALLSSETALLADPDTETAFLKKFADHNLLTFRYRDRQLVTSEHDFTEADLKVRQREKGPFIVCVDTSDSMSGLPEQIAKVLCFAILKMAARENRRAFLINFSVGIKTLDLYDLSRSVDQVADFLKMSFRGGTDISPALYEVLRQLKGENYRDADVLVISDFIMYKVEPDILEGVRYFQQNKETQFHSLTLAEDPPGQMIDLFDSNWMYDPREKGIIRKLLQDLKEIEVRD